MSHLGSTDNVLPSNIHIVIRMYETRQDAYSLDATVEMELGQEGPSICSGMSTSPW